MLFWNKICGFTAIFFLSAIFSSAQIPYNIKVPGIEVSKKLIFTPALVTNKLSDKRELNRNRPFAVIPQNYYTQHFGIMCKKELAIEKTTKIPFRFRLGSLQQCNYLEGKR